MDAHTGGAAAPAPVPPGCGAGGRRGPHPHRSGRGEHRILAGGDDNDDRGDVLPERQARRPVRACGEGERGGGPLQGGRLPRGHDRDLQRAAAAHLRLLVQDKGVGRRGRYLQLRAGAALHLQVRDAGHQALRAVHELLPQPEDHRRRQGGKGREDHREDGEGPGGAHEDDGCRRAVAPDRREPRRRSHVPGQGAVGG